jgi:hypothetical protein
MPVLPRWWHKGWDPRNQLLWGQHQFMIDFAATTETLPLTRGRLEAAAHHLLAFDSNPLTGKRRPFEVPKLTPMPRPFMLANAHAGFHAKVAAVIIGLHGFGARPA